MHQPFIAITAKDSDVHTPYVETDFWQWLVKQEKPPRSEEESRARYMTPEYPSAQVKRLGVHRAAWTQDQIDVMRYTLQHFWWRKANGFSLESMDGFPIGGE